MKDIDLIFDKVCTEKGLPLDEGLKVIYVFRDTSDKDKDHWYIHKVLYIGKSIDADGRLNASHNKIPLAKARLKNGHFLTFAYCVFHGNVSDETIKMYENALLLRTKPPLNSNNINHYHYEPITLRINGDRSTLLPDSITIESDEID